MPMLSLAAVKRALARECGYTPEFIADLCDGLTTDEDRALHLNTVLSEARALYEQE